MNSSVSTIDSYYMDPCMCVGYCITRGYSLGAMRDRYCYCGDEPGYRVEDSLCTTQCRGNSMFPCGGPFKYDH